MEKKIEDYLHLYLGCDVYMLFSDGSSGISLLNKYYVYYPNITPLPIEFKPLLRPLVTMTDEEAIKIAAFAFDLDKHNYPISDYHVRKPEKGTTIIVNIDNDWFDKMIRIGMDSGNIYNEKERIYNQPQIFHFLLSKHFDLFNLIESGLAIDKTTLNTI